MVVQLGLDIGSTMAESKNTNREKGQRWVFPSFNFYLYEFQETVSFHTSNVQPSTSNHALRKKTTYRNKPRLELHNWNSKTNRKGRKTLTIGLSPVYFIYVLINTLWGMV